MPVISHVQNIINSFETLRRDMDTVSNKIKNCHSEQDDMLHEIELTKFNACEGYNLSKELQLIRHKRRKYLEQEEQLDILRGFMNKYKWLVNELKPIVIVLENKKEQQTNRKYTPKIRTNLKIVKTQKMKETAR